MGLLTALMGESPAFGELQTVSYTYDALGRLTTVIYDDAVQITYTYDDNGNIVSKVVGSATTGIGDEPGDTSLPTSFMLGPSYPNPFRSSAFIRYEVPLESDLRLDIIDVRGRLVRTLVSGVQHSGVHTAVWDGRDAVGRSVAAGTYLMRLKAPEFMEVRKITVAR